MNHFQTLLGSLGVAFALALAGCGWQPKDSVIVTLQSEHEFVRASLSNNEVEPRIHQPLKWVDDNTWQTTVGLPAGNYQFIARSSDGRYFQQALEYRPEVRRYQIVPEKRNPQAHPTPDLNQGVGPVLTFQIPGALRQLNGRQAFVIAHGERTTLTRGTVANGRLQVRLQQKGTFRLLVLIPGSPAMEALFPSEPLLEDKDYGFVNFQPSPGNSP